MTAPKPETVEAMRAARVQLPSCGAYLPLGEAAVVADRLVAEAVQAERRRHETRMMLVQEALVIGSSYAHTGPDGEDYLIRLRIRRDWLAEAYGDLVATFPDKESDFKAAYETLDPEGGQ